MDLDIPGWRWRVYGLMMGLSFLALAISIPFLFLDAEQAGSLTWVFTGSIMLFILVMLNLKFFLTTVRRIRIDEGGIEAAVGLRQVAIPWETMLVLRLDLQLKEADLSYQIPGGFAPGRRAIALTQAQGEAIASAANNLHNALVVRHGYG